MEWILHNKSGVFLFFVHLLLEVNGLETYHGNRLQIRDEVMEAQNPRVFMDTKIPLTHGALKMFKLYTVPLDAAPSDPVYIRLQVWQPYVRDEFQFGLLRWEQRAQITEFGKELEIPVTIPYDASEGDCVGFTTETPFNPVSVSLSSTGRTTYFREVYTYNREELPLVGEKNYNFEKVENFKPWEFSLGVVLDDGVQWDGSEVTFHGNEVSEGSRTLTAGTQHAWIDVNVPLTDGFLKEFAFYLGAVDPSSVPLSIRFQVWEVIDDTHFRLTSSHTWTMTSHLGGRQQLKVCERVGVTANHRFGWTCESSICPITYDFKADHQTKVMAVDQASMPLLGQVYTFDFGYPYQMSVGVLIGQDDRISESCDTEMEDETTNGPSSGAPSQGPRKMISRGMSLLVLLFIIPFILW